MVYILNNNLECLADSPLEEVCFVKLRRECRLTDILEEDERCQW